MAFCTKCGQQLEEGVNYCPNCGEPQEKTDGNGSANETAKASKPAAGKHVDNDKLMGILAYLSFLVLIPIFAAPDSKFARYHVNQGLLLLVVEASWSTVKGVLTTVFGLLGLPVMAVVLSVFDLAFVVLMIMGIVNVCNGEEKELPVIGKYRILK